MKKLLALFLALITLLTMVSCASSLAEDETGENTSDTQETAATEEEKGEIIYPDTFSAGFGRAEMSPASTVTLTLGGESTSVKDPLFATCVAVCDGENVALLFHMDMKETPQSIFDTCTERIEKEFGIPAENVIMTATHTHASPHTTLNNPGNIKWRTTLFNAVVEAADAALRDLAPAEIYTGTGDTTGFAFVRRYLLADGTYKMGPAASYNPVDYETVADPELRTIRFDRGDEKDIILANWQSHYGASGTAITSDFVHYMRLGVEEDMDAHFAYFNGASGNINLNNYLGTKTYADYMQVGTALAGVVAEAVQSETKAESGKVVTNHFNLVGQVKQDSEERRAQAKEIASAEESEKNALITKYGFDSIHDVNSTNTRATMDEYTEIPLTVISFGDVAFAANPFELFDISGKEIRDGSPFQMTFNCSYSNGHLGYMPPDEIFPHGAYEVFKAFFVAGTAENVVTETVRMLQENQNNA